MYIKCSDQNLYLDENFQLSPKKSFFVAYKFKRHTDDSITFFLKTCKGKYLAWDLKNKNKFSLIESFQENKLIWIHFVQGNLYTRYDLKINYEDDPDNNYSLILKSKKLFLKKGLIDKKYFELINKSIDREPLGEGTYGWAYSNPRILCKHENIDNPDIQTELSKIFKFFDKKEISKIYNSIKSLFENDEHAEKYMFLPLRMCKSVIKTEWGICPYQLIYRLGRSYEYIVEKNRILQTENNYVNIFLPFKNILKAILFLNTKNLAHFDLKFNNIAVDVSTDEYKLIDLDKISSEYGYHSIYVKKNLPIIAYLLKGKKEQEPEKEKEFFNDVNDFLNKTFSSFPKFKKKLTKQYYLTNGFEILSHKELLLRYDLFSFGILLLKFVELLPIPIEIDFLIDFLKVCFIQKKKELDHQTILNTYDNMISSLDIHV